MLLDIWTEALAPDLDLRVRCISSFRNDEASAISSFWLTFNSTIKVQHHPTTSILEDFTKTRHPSKLFLLFSIPKSIPFSYQRQCIDALISRCRLWVRSRGHQESPRIRTRSTCHSRSLAFPVDANWLWETESKRKRPTHPDNRRILNQCKSRSVENAA